MFLVGGQLIAQQTITGVVSDEEGPLPGATIIVKGTSNGVTSDFDGNYSIKASEGDILVVSFVGFEDQEITMSSNQDVVNVSLSPDNELEEVVVTG
jgi:hypothetical protein